MTPVGGDANYSTYHAEVTADNITGTAGQEFWVICQYEADYTNTFGVTNLAGTDALAAFFRYDLFVSDVPYNKPPVCDVQVVTTMPHVGKGWIEFDASGSSDPDGDPLGFEWDFDDDGTFGDAYDSGTDENPTKNWDTDYVGQVCVRVSDGAGGEDVCCVDVDITALMEINVVGSPNKTISTTSPKDIACDPSMDQVAISIVNSSTWHKYTNNYGTATAYNLGWSYPTNWDWNNSFGLWGARYPSGSYYSIFNWSNWSGGNSGAYWFSMNVYGFRDVCNLQNSNNVWGFYDFAPAMTNYSVFFQCQYFGHQGFPYWVGAPWYNGTGNAGVVTANILGIDMMVYSAGYKMYFLEDLPATNTAVVERYALSSSPTYELSFGQDFLYDALDITVDSNNYVYVLEKDSNGDPVIWAWDSSGALVGTSEPLTTAEISGTPLRIDAFVSSDPDEVHVLHSSGVTEFAMQ
jgi:hypothetical protein